MESIGLDRHGRQKGHRQPVLKLRILTVQPHPVGVTIDLAYPAQRIVAQINPWITRICLAMLGLILRLQVAVVTCQPVTQLLQSDDVLRQMAVDRGIESRMCKAFDLIAVPSCVIHCKRGMGLEPDAGPDLDLIFAGGDLLGGCIRGKQMPGTIIEAHGGHARSGPRHQLVRSLQIMVLQRRLVDLLNDRPLIACIGTRRVERLGTIDKGAIEDIGTLLGRRIGVVPGVTAATQHEAENDRHTGVGCANRRWA